MKSIEEIINYDHDFVFLHTLSKKIFTRFTAQTLIKKYNKRISSPYTKSRVTREIEKIYTGDYIRQQKVGLYHSDENKPKIFEEKFISLLVPLPKSVLRTDDAGNEKPHSTSCEFAQDNCSCWCEGKYHGIRL